MTREQRTRTRNKRNKLSRTELKILVFNKIRSGLSYDEAVKQVTAELEQINETARKNGNKKV